jgi:hypothetical protein
MQTNIVLIPKKGRKNSRIGIQLHYMPFEWNNCSEGELRTTLLDSFLEIEPKHWNFTTTRPFKAFSCKSNRFHHFMIEEQLKRARDAYKELESLMIEGQMCGHHIEALYMERNRLHWISNLREMNWNIILS